MDTKLFVNKQAGGMFAVVDREVIPGKAFWVHSVTGSDTAGNGYNPDAPVATLDYAVANLVTASKGDVVYLMPGHAENIAGATGCRLSKIGVKVLGLGQGSLRPTLSITAAAGTIAVSAADVWIENVLVIGNFLNIVSAFTVTAGGLTIKDVETRDGGTNVLGALIQFSIASGCHDVTFDGYKHIGFTGGLTGIATHVISAAGTCDRWTIQNTRIYCHVSTGTIVQTGIGYDQTFENIRIINTHATTGVGIACHNTSTGFVENVVGMIGTNTVKTITGTGLSVGANVKYTNAVNAYAGLWCYTVDS